MSLGLGVDTGGTYTDAVLIRDEQKVVASAKALTTRPDLAVGIGAAVAEVLRDIDVSEIGMAALSTTLATNALVEGQGERVALIAAGFTSTELDKNGISAAMQGDPVLLLGGRINHAGDVAEPLDRARLESWLVEAPDVAAYAVAGLFAVRNPMHELEIAEIVRRATGRPVSLSHHLSARLNGPKRALTAVLNARLVGMIDRLIQRAGAKLDELGVRVPLMVVRGDGALISAEQAREAPIETILSGPAASIVGARWLTGAEDALVSDIGGTTTDIAILRNGRPAIDPMGARVGPWRTMVEAVAMRTHGLGGDSEVHFVATGLSGGVRLGPRRVLPIALLAKEAPEIVHGALDVQLRNPAPGEWDGRFVRAVPGVSAAGLAVRDADLLARIGNAPRPLGEVIRQRVETASLARLVARGAVQVSAVTPTDAAHALGLSDAWDAEAAEKALRLFGRRRTGAGELLGADARDVARSIVAELTRRTAEAMLETAFDEDNLGLTGEEAASHPLTRAAFAGHRGTVRLDASLMLPLVGLGASAPVWYPGVGKALGTRMILPKHAGVANAIGAVVGRIRVRREAVVTAPAEGRYRAHLESGPMDFPALDPAIECVESALRAEAESEARSAGASGIDVTARRELRTAPIEGREVFVEALVVIEATGRPRIAV